MSGECHYPLACNHAIGANPRMAGVCVKCGKPMQRQRLKDTGPAKPFTPDLASDHAPLWGEKDPTRDLQFESKFLADALELAQRLTGISNFSYPVRVNDRLDIGRQRYGDGDYLSKDNLVEVLEETPDLAAYAMLELQRLRRFGTTANFDELRLDLIAVAAYGAVADYYARRAASRVSGDG